MVGSRVGGHHYTTSMSLKLRMVEAGFVDMNPKQCHPHGRSESLHLSVSMCSREFFGDPDFFNKEDPINLYYDHLSKNYLLSSLSVIDRLQRASDKNKTRFEFIEPLTDDPKRFEEVLYNGNRTPIGWTEEVEEEL